MELSINGTTNPGATAPGKRLRKRRSCAAGPQCGDCQSGKFMSVEAHRAINLTDQRRAARSRRPIKPSVQVDNIASSGFLVSAALRPARPRAPHRRRGCGSRAPARWDLAGRICHPPTSDRLWTAPTVDAARCAGPRCEEQPRHSAGKNFNEISGWGDRIYL